MAVLPDFLRIMASNRSEVKSNRGLDGHIDTFSLDCDILTKRSIVVRLAAAAT